MHSYDEHSGFLDLELTSNAWLTNHFVAKSSRRFRQVVNLPINPGDKVLDLCCGPGHYSDLFSLRVGSTGFVCGVDKDPVLIDEATHRRSHLITKDRLDFYCSEVEPACLPKRISSQRFDVIVLFNCLSYFPAPQVMLASYTDLLRPHGRIIVKDSDMGHFLISPLDDDLTGKVIRAARESPSLSFDNFFGRHLPGLIAGLPAAKAEVEVWSYPMLSPLSDHEKVYVAGNMMTLLQQAEANLNGEECLEWKRRYSLQSEEALFDSDDFFFLMHEIVAIATIH